MLGIAACSQPRSRAGSEVAYLNSKLINALDKSMRKAFLAGLIPPGLLLAPSVLGPRCLPLPLHVSGFALGVQGGRKLQHALCGVLAAVEEYVLNHLQQLLVELVVVICNDLQWTLPLSSLV